MKEKFAIENSLEARKAPLANGLYGSLANPNHFPAIPSFVEDAPVSVF
jgi:hypothetical protein